MVPGQAMARASVEVLMDPCSPLTDKMRQNAEHDEGDQRSRDRHRPIVERAWLRDAVAPWGRSVISQLLYKQQELLK